MRENETVGEPFPDSAVLSSLIAISEGKPADFCDRKPDRRPRGRYRGRLRLIVTPGFKAEPLPDGAPWAFIGMSDQLTWEKCYCPWWHRIPYFDRRVHSELP